MRLEFFPYPFLTGIAILLIFLIVLRQRGKSGSYLFCFALFWLYLLLLVDLTLFPTPLITLQNGLPWRQSLVQILARVNLHLFNYGGRVAHYPFIIAYEIISNILLTVPFGFGIIFVAPSFAKRSPLWAFVVGIVIEVSQLFSLLIWGVGYRVADINDVIWNTLGVLIGFGLFKAFGRIFLKIKLRFGLQTGGLVAYIENIIDQTSTNNH